MATYRKVCNSARGWIGTPYHHQQSVKGAGCDCLGLLRGVYREVVGAEPEKMPNYSPGWDEVSKREDMLTVCARHLVDECGDYLSPRSDNAGNGDASARHGFAPGLVTDRIVAPGRVIVFRMKRTAVAKHCGVVVQGGRFIHSHEGHGVVEVDLAPHWAAKIVGVFAFPGAL